MTEEEMTTFTIINDEGLEIECEILFTFNSKEYLKDYVVYTPIDDKYVDEEGYSQICVYSYIENGDGEGGLQPIEDDAEWEMIEEIIDSYLEEN